jgi:hypothetical protein
MYTVVTPHPPPGDRSLGHLKKLVSKQEREIFNIYAFLSIKSMRFQDFVNNGLCKAIPAAVPLKLLIGSKVHHSP